MAALGTHSIPPSPSDLGRCLSYIAEHPEFNLMDVQQYKTALAQEGYAPDIIGELPREDLMAHPVNMSHGDAIRFKRACGVWWDAPDGKCQRAAASSNAGNASVSASYVVRYKRRWTKPDGTVVGLNMFWGKPMKRNEDWDGLQPLPDPEVEGWVWYLDAARGDEWVEVPPNHIVVTEDNM